MYRGSPSIADRMKVLDFKASLRKQDEGPTIDGGEASASMPGQVAPPMTPPTAAPPMGEPTPDEMNAASTGQVYADNQEALADVHSRLTDIAVDLTNHVGTVDMQSTMDNLENDMPDRFSEHIIALRDRVESLAKIVKVIRMQNPEMVGHGMEGIDPMMASMGEQSPMNMPAAGPAGMPPGGMPMPGPMSGGM
jgi:hypothetical protein